MNIIIDSSGWLEYFSDGKSADFFAEVILNKTSTIIIPVIIIYEIFKKILVEADEDRALQVIAVFKNYQIENIDDSTAIKAARLSYEYKIPMADSFIYAVTLKHKAILWTQDEHFKNLPGVKYIEKKN
ncbi:MAG: type II toxin-antitoxin system VapC family toxin [bacterium]